MTVCGARARESGALSVSGVEQNSKDFSVTTCMPAGGMGGVGNQVYTTLSPCCVFDPDFVLGGQKRTHRRTRGAAKGLRPGTHTRLVKEKCPSILATAVVS